MYNKNLSMNKEEINNKIINFNIKNFIYSKNNNNNNNNNNNSICNHYSNINRLYINNINRHYNNNINSHFNNNRRMQLILNIYIKFLKNWFKMK